MAKAKIAPCLWFDDRAEEAANFYVATFRACGQDAAIGEILRYGESGPRPAGTVMTVTFTLAGQECPLLPKQEDFTRSTFLRESLCSGGGARSLHGDFDAAVRRPALWRIVRRGRMRVAEALGRNDVGVDALRH